MFKITKNKECMCVFLIDREMVTSLAFHSINEHEFEGEKFKRCRHSLPPPGRTQYLKKGSLSHEALKEIIFDPRLLKALPYVTLFCHTGDLEVFHNTLLKYTPKRLYFPPNSEHSRTATLVIFSCSC